MESETAGGPALLQVEELVPSCFLLRSALELQEEVRLFDFVMEKDGTDWDSIRPCMNPTPKTLELVSQPGAEKSPTLDFCSENEAAVVEMVGKAIGILNWSRPIKSMTMAAIRYCASGSSPTIGSCFPPHVDHCNDGSWVVLFSLGCTADFHVKTPGTAQHSFEMQSGEILVFDPSSEAAIMHGVAGVGGAQSCARELGDRFEALRGSRYGVQCRVSW